MSDKKTVLIIDDEAGLRDLTSRFFQDEGFLTITAADGPSGLKTAKENNFDVVVLDMSLPKMNGLEVLNGIKEEKPDVPVIMVTAYGSTQTAIEALRLGAYDYRTKPVDLDELLMVVNRALEQKQIIDENAYLRGEIKKKYGFDNIVGENPDIQRAYVMAAQVARTNATVLVLGETGTGKEYLARTVHYQSDRANGPFVKVNCAALPESLLESELFGHEKGSFTHALARREGRFELAHKGTIFLDEIGEVTTNVQTKLLRVLQEKQFERVGGTDTIQVDVRIIAATNKNLAEAIKAKEFREDLFYRLNVISIKLPPLRERPEDITIFVKHFLKYFANDTGKKVKRFSEEAMEVMLSHDWPGNIRELQNVVERSVILCNGETIRPEHLMLSPMGIRKIKKQSPDALNIPVNAPLRDVEKVHIERVLKHNAWNQSTAAQILGIDRKTLRNKIKEFHLEKEEAN